MRERGREMERELIRWRDTQQMREKNETEKQVREKGFGSLSCRKSSHLTFLNYLPMPLPIIHRPAYSDGHANTVRNTQCSFHDPTCWSYIYTAFLNLAASIIPKPKQIPTNSNDQMQRFILSRWCIFAKLALLCSSYRTWDYANRWTMKTHQIRSINAILQTSFVKPSNRRKTLIMQWRNLWF